MEEIVVTAQKREEHLKDVPISISVLGGTDLDRSTFAGAMEALRTVPGVAMSKSGATGGTLLVVRGIGAQGAAQAGASAVGYYLDSAPFGLIRNPITPDLNIYDLERVEVLRGPQGTLFGANSVNGLVRVLTRDADLNEFELKTRLLSSSTIEEGGGNYRGDVAVNVPLVRGKLAARAVIGYQSLGGWVDGPLGSNLNDGDARNYRLKLNAQPTDAFGIGLSAWINRADYGGFNQSDDNGNVGATTPLLNSDDFDAYSVKLTYDLSHVSITSMSSYVKSTMAGVLDSYVHGLPNTAQNAGFESKIKSQELLLTSRPDSSWKWTTGIFYRDAEEDFFVTWPPVLALPLAWVDFSKSYAIFGQIGHRFLHEKLEWTLGVRYFNDDYEHRQNPASAPPLASLIHDERSYEATTPRVVLSWYPSANATVYAVYGQGYRSGLSQHAAVLALTGTQVPDADPDKLTNYELGTKGDLFGGHLSLDTSVYYLTWQDVQQGLSFNVSTPIYTGPVSGIANGTTASGVGIDVGLTARPVESVELSLAGSWNDVAYDEEVRLATNNNVRARKGDRLNFSPEYTFSASFAYRFPLGRSDYTGQFKASAQYTSELMTLQAGPVAPIINSSDTIFVGQAHFLVDSGNHWAATLFVDNLNDERGAAGPRSPGLQVAMTNRLRPRTVGLQFDYNF